MLELPSKELRFAAPPSSGRGKYFDSCSHLALPGFRLSVCLSTCVKFVSNLCIKCVLLSFHVKFKEHFLNHSDQPFIISFCPYFKATDKKYLFVRLTSVILTISGVRLCLCLHLTKEPND